MKNLIGKSALIVWCVIVAFFLLYFVMLNNAEFILASFIGFVVLSFVVFRSRRNTIVVVVCSFAFIFSSLVLYHLAASLQFLSPELGISLSIIGYYLFITVVIALFINTLYEHDTIHKSKISRLVNAFKTNVGSNLAPIMLCVGIMLLVLPIWPVGTQIHLSKLPYTVVTITGIANPSNQSGLYMINLNLSAYASILNPQRSNMLLYYNDGRPINIHIIGIAPPANDIPIIISDNYTISKNTTLLLYFTSFGTGFGNHTILSNYNASDQPIYLNAMTSPLLNALAYSTSVVRYNGYAKGNNTAYMNISALPYYELENICAPGTAHNATIYFNTTKNESLFVFSNESAEINAVHRGNNQISYAYYIARFTNYSTARIINRTSGTISVSYNRDCLDYAFVNRHEQNTTVIIRSSYIENRSLTNKIYVPAAIVDPSIYQNEAFGFATEGVMYLYSTLNVT